MRTVRAAVGSSAFFVAAPGTVAGLVPWLITRWEVREGWPGGVSVLGLIVVGLGLVPLVQAFVEFTRAGGTPMPAAPTQRLVVTGFHRYLRNPMYVGVVSVILGQALLLGQLSLVLYGVTVWLVVAGFVRVYEEPTLIRQFGDEYLAYRRAVPAWLPRLRPWSPGGAHRA